MISRAAAKRTGFQFSPVIEGVIVLGFVTVCSYILNLPPNHKYFRTVCAANPPQLDRSDKNLIYR
jgi:hypothetical protein